MSSWFRAAALAAMAFACLPGEARADGGAAQYRYVPVCDGSYGPVNASGPSTLTYDSHGQLCTVGTAGGGGTTTPFAPGGNYATLAVTAATANVGLPTGATVVVYNTGAIDAYVHLGTSAGVTATVNQDVVKAGQSVALAVGVNTFLAAIAASGTTTLTLSGGSGIFTGVGGGGSGGGGGVTQATIPWVDNITQWAGSALGAISSYGTSPGAVLVPGVNAFVTNTLTVTANAGTNLNTSALALDTSVGITNTDLGAPGATACVSDTGTCSANALLQRIAQRVSTLIAGGAVTQGTTPWVVGVTQWAGSTLGAISNYGTAPGNVLVPGVNAFITGSIGLSPAFQPGNAYATLAVTTATANVALPAGATVVVYNTGANDAFVHLGTSGAVTATASQDLVKVGQSVAYVVGANTFIAAITASSTTTLILSGGTGGFAAVGGGGGAGGSAFSVTDSAAWTASSSSFVPSGGEFNAGAAALSTGQQGTIALGSNRHQLVTEDSAAGILAAVQGSIPAGTNNIGVVSASVTAALPTTPTATITLPATTTAYTANQLMANSATAGSVVNPSFAIGNTAGAAIIARVRLAVNDATSTAWGAQTIQVDLWTTTPTWTNGDRGTWSPATGTGAHLGAYTCTMSAEYGDGAYAECAPTVGSYSLVKLASGTSVFWSLKAISGSGVTGASKVFTLTPEVQN